MTRGRYPDCDEQSHSVNICHKVNHNIGLVRTMLYVIGPLFVSLVCLANGTGSLACTAPWLSWSVSASPLVAQVIILCLSGCASSYLNAELEQARHHAEELETDMDDMKKGVKKRTGRYMPDVPPTRRLAHTPPPRPASRRACSPRMRLGARACL